jgi:transposase
MTKQEIYRLQRWRLGIIRHALEVSKNVAKTCRHYGISKQSYYNWYARYREFGEDGLKDRSRRPKSIKTLKAENESNIKAIFEMLHAPPREFGINRTSWRITDIRECLKKRGMPLSKHTIRKIVKNAGYSWRKARIVLTSNDPQYRRKLNKIKKILGSLGSNERFFSIDEYGPFAIKMIGGRKLVGPNEFVSVPQFQQSKGSLILTAALELSTNQVTHFYSQHKNTNEMIRLLQVLLIKYQNYENIYLSWDAASWHISNKLKQKIYAVNSRSYRRKHNTPRVRLVPLPASAQFLNVIESVFSGMAKAIIHNSNYGSIDEAKSAIDQHFKERNEYFQQHLKVAGNKIWGHENSQPQFSETNNCKDRRFR